MMARMPTLSPTARPILAELLNPLEDDSVEEFWPLVCAGAPEPEVCVTELYPEDVFEAVVAAVVLPDADPPELILEATKLADVESTEAAANTTPAAVLQ